MNALATLLNATEEEKVATGTLHTPGEIAQQPATWSHTFQLFQQRQTEIREFLRRAGVPATPNTPPTVLLIGAGTSDYVGRSLVSLLRRQWDCEVIACPSTDLITQLEDVLRPRRQYLCISFSRSGDSPEGVAVLERMLKTRPDIYQLVITCNRDGRMIHQAEQSEQALGICLDDSVNDRGLAMTSSFSNMVVLGQCLAHIHRSEEYFATPAHLIEAGNNFLPIAANCAAALASGDYKKACFVGSGSLSAVAQESALKLLEMTAGKVFTMSASTAGLRHGPMAALDHDTLLVNFMSGDERVRAYDQDLLKEIGSKGLVKTWVSIGAGAEIISSNGRAQKFLAPDVRTPLADDYRPPVDVIFGQLLGLFFSLYWKLKPDDPSPNGAISRVVQNVNVY